MSAFRRVCFVGLDRIIGSIGLGLKRTGFRGQIVAVSDKSTIKSCWDRGIITDGSEEIEPALKGADLVMLSGESEDSIGRLEQVLTLAEKNAVISEMTHVKNEVNHAFSKSARTDLHYVGFRLLGDVDQASKVEKSDKFFLEEKFVILTPRGKDDLDAYAQLSEMMGKLGAKCIAMSPETHDRALAEMHQAPQLVMMAILQSLFRNGATIRPTPEMLGEKIVREITDLSLMQSSGWIDQVEANKKMVADSLDVLLAHISQLKTDLQLGLLSSKLKDLVGQSEKISQTVTENVHADLILVAGKNFKILERVSELLASSRISVVEMNRMEHAEPGTFKITLASKIERDKAFKLLQNAGIEVANLS
jgi:prephenate dehydrogenase